MFYKMRCVLLAKCWFTDFGFPGRLGMAVKKSPCDAPHHESDKRHHRHRRHGLTPHLTH